MIKPIGKEFETCPMLARSDWGVGHIQQTGLTNCFSKYQSPVGFHGPRTAGWLVFLNGCHRGEDARLPVGETRLGSSWLSDLVVTGIGIGSQHALLRLGTDSATIEPLSGDRLVRVNNQQIKSAQSMEDGDLVTIGELHAVFRKADRMSPGYKPVETPKPLSMPAQASGIEMTCGWIVFSNGFLMGQDFRLVNGLCRIGTEMGLEVVIPDTNLSKLCVTLVVSSKECRIDSISDKSTIKINGNEAAPGALLRESDLIMVDHLEGYLKWFLP